jgi:hypothetical protein
VRAGLEAANRRETRAWEGLRSRADWEQYRDARIRALRESLGAFPQPPADLKVRVTGTIAGTGFAVEKLAFVSRPGLVVTANLYRPEPAGKSMPGILVCHSHHNPKTEGELQDMGATWARQGCLVLVMDQLGHRERRQHPFADAKSYPRPFRVGRQDYHFRYNVGLQLSLVGESLVVGCRTCPRIAASSFGTPGPPCSAAQTCLRMSKWCARARSGGTTSRSSASPWRWNTACSFPC